MSKLVDLYETPIIGIPAIGLIFCILKLSYKEYGFQGCFSRIWRIRWSNPVLGYVGGSCEKDPGIQR